MCQSSIICSVVGFRLEACLATEDVSALITFLLYLVYVSIISIASIFPVGMDCYSFRIITHIQRKSYQIITLYLWRR